MREAFVESSLGTIFLFRGTPLQQQPGFSIYANGGAVARALVEVYWGGTLLVGEDTQLSSRGSTLVERVQVSVLADRALERYQLAADRAEQAVSVA